MDSQDSSAPPFSRLHHQQNHPQSLLPAVFFNPHAHTEHQPNNNSYSLHNSNNAVNSTTSAAVSHQQQSTGFPFNSMVSAPVPMSMDHHFSDGSPSGGGGSIEPTRKKRGRPRKYSLDNNIGLGLSPAHANQISSAVGHSDSGGGLVTHSGETSAKRKRGRPPGSVKKQMDALGSSGVGFTPHIILIDTDEDIASKIMEFSQHGSRTVCILSAHGSVSNVTLQQSTSFGTVSYEGQFDIISLSFLMSDSSDDRNRTGCLNVSLASSDGRVLGGGVAGILKASSPVQLVVGSFIADAKKSKSGLSSPPPSHMLNFGPPVAGISPLSAGASSESAEENDASPLNCGSGPYSNVSQPIESMPMYSPMGWPNSMKMHPPHPHHPN